MRPYVHVQFTEAAAKRFGVVTAENIGRKLALIIDGKVVMAPAIQAPITDGRVTISVSGRGPREQAVAADVLVEALRDTQQPR